MCCLLAPRGLLRVAWPDGWLLQGWINKACRLPARGAPLAQILDVSTLTSTPPLLLCCSWPRNFAHRFSGYWLAFFSVFAPLIILEGAGKALLKKGGLEVPTWLATPFAVLTCEPGSQRGRTWPPAACSECRVRGLHPKQSAV